MTRYAPLVQLNVIHDYFSDPAKLQLTFRPDARTADWMDEAGCAMQALDNRLAVFHDMDARGGGVASRDPTHLRFDVIAEDPLFVEFTADWPGGRPGAPLFRGEDAKPGDDGVWRLVPAHGGISTVPPQGVHLRLSLPAGGAPSGGGEVGRRYRLDLASRATAWKYILLDDWGDVTPVVVDPAGAITFSDAAPEVVADGRSALAITSAEAIRMADRPSQRFQLRAAAAGGGAGALLIATLPAAAPGRLGLDRPATGPRMVSEIYVAR